MATTSGIMAGSTPPRPPRMGKPQRETTGLLMSVIRALSASESNEQRDKEKAKLEKEYKRSDQKLDELIAENHEDLTVTMQAFSKVSLRLAASQEKISSIKESLETCKNLLHCRRDELKKLWLEGIEHKHVLYLLEQIENLKDVPEKVEAHISKKHYLHATEVLVSSIKLLEGSLDGVEALKEVKSELQAKKEVYLRLFLYALGGTNGQVPSCTTGTDSLTLSPPSERKVCRIGAAGYQQHQQPQATTTMHLHEVTIEELHKHLYIRSTSEVYRMQRQGSGYSRDSSPFHRHGSDRSRKDTPASYGQSEKRDGGTPVKRILLQVTPVTPTHKYRQQTRSSASGSSMSTALGTETPEPICEDLLALDPEEDTMHFMAILVECFVLLNCIPDAIDTIKARMQKELRSIVRRAAQQIADNTQAYQGESLSAQNQPHVLLDLLELVFEQFRCVAQAHECVLANFKRALNSQQLEVPLYDMADVWSKIQAVLQVLLSDYLDVQNTASSQQQPTAAFTEATTDVASFFAKRKPTRTKKMPLFKFDASSHALNMNSYLKEQKQGLYGSSELLGGEMVCDKSDKFFVCSPLAKNITVIFKPLMRFISEIEQALGCSGGSHCTLHAFVTDYVKDVFIAQVRVEIGNSIDIATKNLDAWKANTDPEVQKTLNVARPLLQSTVSIEKSLQELWDLMNQLPIYAEHFLNLICTILVNYKETCQAAYRGIVQPESEDKRIISATWAKDEDISRLLRSLPNWTNLQKLKENRTPDYEESPEEIRLRNLKESAMLTTNLGDTLIPHHEILGDVVQLRILALLQESLEWFGGRINHFACSLPGSFNSPIVSPISPSTSPILDISPVADNTIISLQQVAREFEELADTCLLVLHLEVRVHCFYYLLPIAKQGQFASAVDTQDPDPEIVKLNKDLSSIEEALTTTLQPRKFKYVFEGLGHLVGSILINSAQYIKRINANGVKKMCRNIFAIQQNLTNITMSREVALDHARQYFELMYHNIEDILNLIVDQGPQFGELEYMNALNLLHRSLLNNDPTELNMHFERLKEILSEVAVTV